jgi:ATP-dependent DNA helicase RecQ
VDRIKPKTFSRTLKRWEYPTDRVEQTWAAKRRDADIVAEYFSTRECRMKFIVNHLNDLDTSPCGLCDNCTSTYLTANFLPSELAVAHEFLRRGYLKIEPRRRGWNNVNIPPAEQLMEGKCLSKWKDGGFGDRVAQGKQIDQHF